MMKATWKRNTTGLREAVLHRAEEARARAEEAIRALAAEGRPVNFNSVSARGGVTKAYLYTQPSLRERIALLRREKAAGGRTRSAAPDAAVAERDRRIAELEAENRRLRADLEAFRG